MIRIEDEQFSPLREKVTMAKQIREEVEGEVYEDQMEIIADADGNLQYKQMPGARQMSLFDKQ